MRKILEEHEESKKVLDEYKIALNNKGNPSGIDFRVNVVKNNLFYQNLKNDYNFKNEIPKFFQFYLNDFEKYYF
jgi:mevalonate kinase